MPHWRQTPLTRVVHTRVLSLMQRENSAHCTACILTIALRVCEIEDAVAGIDGCKSVIAAKRQDEGKETKGGYGHSNLCRGNDEMEAYLSCMWVPRVQRRPRATLFNRAVVRGIGLPCHPATRGRRASHEGRHIVNITMF